MSALAQDLSGGAPVSVLYLVHALAPAERSGTPLVTAEYATRMAERGNRAIVVHGDPQASSWPVTPSQDPAGFARYAVPLTAHHSERWSLEEPSVEPNPEDPANAAFLAIVRAEAPDLIHVVDNVNLPLAWPELAAEAGFPVVRTVSCAEDLCALVAPVSPRSDPRGFCLPPLTPERCGECVRSVGVFRDGARPTQVPDGEMVDTVQRLLTTKRERSRRQFQTVFDRVIFSAASFRDYFEATLPLDAARVRVIEMGVDPVGPPRRAIAPSDPLVFGLAGMLDRAKGLDTVVDAFSQPELAIRTDYRLVVRGGGDESLIAPLVAVNPNVSYDGPYDEVGFAAFLDQIDVGISASRFETFHRVTREYLLAGVPVIGADVFGIPDVVHPEENGLLFTHAERDGLSRSVRRCLDDRALVAAVRDRCAENAHPIG